jgi:2-methylcitrate dehydratase PrpD
MPSDPAPRDADVAYAVRLADFVIATDWKSVEQRVRQEIKRTFLNWLGCAIGGSRHPSIAIAESALLAVSGPPHATIIGRRRRSDMLNAALLNCMSSSVDGFDDTHAETILHPTGPVASALLALSESRPLSGQDLQLALLLGIDIESRLSKAAAVAPARCKVGWYLTGLTGGVGAAAAVGRALKLPAEQIVSAMGIASGQGAGNRAMHAAMTSAMVPAHAAQCGLRAGLLAEAGFTCGENFIESPNGFLSLFADVSNPGALFADLGHRYELMANNYKPWPCGIVLHAAVDACLKLHRAGGYDAVQIAGIELGVHPTAIVLADRRHPKDGLEAIVSMQHWTAAVLANGLSGPEVNSAAVIADPLVAALRDKVSAAADPALSPDAAYVTIVTTDGRSLSADVEHCLGSASRPMNNRGLEDKFYGLCDGVIERQRADALVAACWQLDELADAAEIAKLAA